MLTHLKEYKDFNGTNYLEEGKHLYRLSNIVNSEATVKERITDNVTAIGNTADSTELQLSNLNQITHNSSAFNFAGSSAVDASVWIVSGVGVVVFGVGVEAGISYIKRVFDQTKGYSHSLQEIELSQL